MRRQDRNEHASAPRGIAGGPSRREWLWETGGGFVGTALTSLLASDGFFGPTAQAAINAPASPLAPKKPHFAAKAKSCIFLFMYGGVSQVDTWDPKPELSKRSGEPMPNLDNDPLLKLRKPGTCSGSLANSQSAEHPELKYPTFSRIPGSASTT